MADKVVGLRIFADAEDKMNLALADVGGARARRVAVHAVRRRAEGPAAELHRRGAAREAIPLYERFVALLRDARLPVETGEFGAMMDVELVNDGPVTLWLER